MAELADAHDSKSCEAIHVGSTPTFGTPTLTNKQIKIPIFNINIQYLKKSQKSKVPHTNFTLELQYLLMDVIVINNSYHIHSKVNVGAGASQKREAPIFNIPITLTLC